MSKMKSRMKKFESIPVIRTTLDSGAIAKYMSKDKFPKISELTEGGFATDVHMVKDEKQERIIIDDSNIYDDYTDFQNGKIYGEDEEMGILDSGLKHSMGKSLILLGKEGKAVFWFNGVWSIIEKQVSNGDFLIPVELAKRVIKRTDKSVVQVLERLELIKLEPAKYKWVNAKELSNELGISELYSYWTFDDVPQILLNTSMSNGPYKFKRINENITISFDLNFIDGNLRCQGAIQKK